MRWTVGCLVLLGLGCALLVQQPGCGESAHYALVRSVADGSPSIDRYHWWTCDVSWYHGHYYAAKGPGLALASAPVFVVLRAAGLVGDEQPPPGDKRGPVSRKTAWPFAVLFVLASALGLFLLMRAAAERVAPGAGLLVAAVLATGTMLLPYATLFASHVPAALLGFAAFVVLMRERRGPPRPAAVAAAGLLAGLATSIEPALAVAAVVVGGYAVLRRALVARALLYGAGAIAGLLPLLAFDQWAFGSVAHQSYADTVLNAGDTGHDQLGANRQGIFGFGVPSLNVLARLLLLNKGLLVATPVAALAVLGLWRLLRDRRWRAEAATVTVLAVAYLVYNAGYWQPYGGDSAGPRFLLPVLPFLALPLAAAFRRAPAVFAALGGLSCLTMIAATLTLPMLDGDSTATWFRDVVHGTFQDTLLGRAGVGSRSLAVAPSTVLLLGALVVAAAGTRWPPLGRGSLLAALAAVVAWGVVGSSTPALLSSGTPAAVTTLLSLVILAVAAAAATLYVRRAELTRTT